MLPVVQVDRDGEPATGRGWRSGQSVCERMGVLGPTPGVCIIERLK
jgi:hypothetical protein